MGLVEIFGNVIPGKGKILKSPLSNSDCVYYNYKIEEYRRSGKSSHWVTRKHGKESVPFYLKDSTGIVLIDPNHAEVDVNRDFIFKSGLGKDPPETVKKFLQKSNLRFEGLLGMNKTMRYTEYFIAPNDKLYIIGTADDNPYVEEATGQSNVEDIMIQKGKNNPFYYISDNPEKKVLNRFRNKMLLGLIGGPALSVIGLILVLLFLGLF